MHVPTATSHLATQPHSGKVPPFPLTLQALLALGPGTLFTCGYFTAFSPFGDKGTTFGWLGQKYDQISQI